MIPNKLLRVEREIEVFDRENNKEIAAFNIDHISLEQLLTIFKPNESGDPLLYDPYKISESQLMILNSFLKEPIIYDSYCYYVLACLGIYEGM